MPIFISFYLQHECAFSKGSLKKHSVKQSTLNKKQNNGDQKQSIKGDNAGTKKRKATSDSDTVEGTGSSSSSDSASAATGGRHDRSSNPPPHKKAKSDEIKREITAEDKKKLSRAESWIATVYQ